MLTQHPSEARSESYVENVRVRLEHRAKPNTSFFPPLGNTSLNTAVYYNDVAIGVLLVQYGSDAHQRDGEVYNALLVEIELFPKLCNDW